MGWMLLLMVIHTIVKNMILSLTFRVQTLAIPQAGQLVLAIVFKVWRMFLVNF